MPALRSPAFRITAPTRGYANAILSASLPADRLPEGSQLELVDPAGASVPVQVEMNESAATLHWVQPHLAPDQSTTLTLRRAAGDATGSVSLTPGDERLDVHVNGQHFTSYHHGPGWAKPFLHPLLGPSGPVNRCWPMEETDEKRDHVHHKGCYVSHGDVNGCDLWSEAEGHGKVVHQSTTAQEAGPVFARLAVSNRWQRDDGTKLLDEQREYRFYNLPDSGRVLDMTTTLTASAGDVVFGDTKEGGLCSVRVATSMDASGAGRIENAYGAINDGECWGRRAPWCDYTGPVNGTTVGIAIFDHPANLRHPTYWHVRNYGLMTANPFGIGYFRGTPGEPIGQHTLPAGEALTFRYRLFIHAGTTRDARVGEQYHGWINPPAVIAAE